MTRKTLNKLEESIRDINEGYMELLNQYPPFRSDLVATRSAFDIPINGFIDYGNDQIANEVANWRKVQGMVGREWRYLELGGSEVPIDLYHHKNSLRFLTNPEVGTRYEKWHLKTKEIREKYFVPFHFQPYIELFILTGKIVAPPRNHYLSTRFSSNSNGQGVSTVIVYGTPSEEELKLVNMKLNPVKQIFGELLGHQNLRETKKRIGHPKDTGKSDVPLRVYAQILALDREKKELKENGKDEWIMREMNERYNFTGITLGNIKTIRRRATNRQKKLFEGYTSPK